MSLPKRSELASQVFEYGINARWKYSVVSGLKLRDLQP